MASGDKPSSGKIVSGVGETLPATSIQDTLPASLSEMASAGPADRSSRASIPPLPTTRYKIGEEIGRGGMGRVVEALDTQLGRTVALKEVLPDGGTIVRRFVREIEITARLEHASIVPLYDSGTTPDGRPFYVMKRVTGRPLDEEIRRAHTLDDRLMLLPSMLAAIDAIAHAHARGVIHRDLKPANILVSEDGQTTVIDWGLAKVIGEVDESGSDATPQAGDSLHTQIGSVFGTPGFMAPEQARGEELTPTVDVYALGATLYQLLAGKPPLGGSSATELIGKTLTHDVTPLASVVQGVPRELNAIVEKALSFDAAVRYKDASELAADVRRFQAGQLVAAHSYTNGQRLARFVRKNRAVLGISSIALVAVAVFGFFSVHRVLVERDVASDARAQALREKLAAETARDRLAERNDALVIERARAALDTNPTLAAAIVAEMSPSSPRIGDARAVAQAAVARGVWRAMKGPTGFVGWAELDATGARLLTVERSGELRIWDLDHSRVVIARKYETDRRMAWAGSMVVVSGKTAPVEILDPAANRSTELPGAPLDDLAIADDGVTAAGVDATGALFRVDLKTGARFALWPGHAVEEVQIAPDGSWVLARDKKLVAAIDRDGHELTTNDQPTAGISRITGRRSLTITHEGALALDLDPTPTWTLIPKLAKNSFFAHGEWRVGENRLDVVSIEGKVWWWNPKIGLFARTKELGMPVREPSTMADDWYVVPTADRVVVLAGDAELSLPYPMALQQPRTLVHRGSTRVVVVADGVILQMDLAELAPRRVSLTEDAVLLGVDTMVQASMSGHNTWVDLTTKAETTIDITEPVSIQQWEAGTKRVLFRSLFSKTPAIYLGKFPDTKFEALLRGQNAWAALVPPDSVIFGPGEDGDHVVIRDRDGKIREIAKLTSPVIVPAKAGPNRAVLLTEKGELLRVDMKLGITDRVTIPLTNDTIIFPSGEDRVGIADGMRLSVWGHGGVAEVTTFATKIEILGGLPDGSALVTLVDHTLWRVALEPGAKPLQLQASAFKTTTDDSGTRVVSQIENHTIDIVDLATSSHWSLPKFIDNDVLAMALPTSNALALRIGGGFLLWNLPVVDTDLSEWVHDRTSARVNSENQLVWPWQVSP